MTTHRLPAVHRASADHPSKCAKGSAQSVFGLTSLAPSLRVSNWAHRKYRSELAGDAWAWRLHRSPWRL